MKELILKLARALNRLANAQPDNAAEVTAAKAEAKAAVDELTAFKAAAQADKEAQTMTPEEQAEVDKALNTIGDAKPA